MSEEAAAPSARERLRHVYWIGGGSGAGKSTISRRLAASHGLRLVCTDNAATDPIRRPSSSNPPPGHRAAFAV